MSLMRRRLASLTARVSALTLLVVLVTALVGATASVVLVERANEQAAVRALAGIADVAQSLAELSPNADFGKARARRALDGLGVEVAVVRTGSPRGVTVTGDPLARRLTGPEVLARLAAGADVSTRSTDGDTVVLLEARAVTGGGGIVVVQRRSDAVAVGDSALRRLLWAFAGVAVLAVVLGWLLSRWIGAPLGATAAAATELAAGRRDLAVAETGPTEVAAVAASVNALARSLAHSEARQREFLLSVSHDLRTPLTAVRGYAESLADGVVPPERVPEVGRIVGAEADRLERMVGDLLDLARLDAHEVDLALAPVDLADLLAAAEPVWRHRCDAVGVRLTVTRPAGAPLVVAADADRLRQALDGLLDNALRVTPAGRPVVVAARRADAQDGPGPDGIPGGWALLEVRDGGPGLAPEDFAVAFDRAVLHERYRGVREVGTGLGLAIVARIVERHGGRVAAGPSPEGGACFTLGLPPAR